MHQGQKVTLLNISFIIGERKVNNNNKKDTPRGNNNL